MTGNYYIFLIGLEDYNNKITLEFIGAGTLACEKLGYVTSPNPNKHVA